KGPVLLERSPAHQHALAGHVIHILDMATDPRVLYPDDAHREGLASMLYTGIVFQSRPIGVIQLYTDSPRHFSQDEVNLLRAVAQLVGAAIDNARLNASQRENEIIQRQIKLASDVQKRMMPRHAPKLPHFEVAARYVPSFELG